MSRASCLLLLSIGLPSAMFAQEQPNLSWFGRPVETTNPEQAPQDPLRDLNPLESLAAGLLSSDEEIGSAFDGSLSYGVILDAVGEFSEADSVQRLNKLRMRTLEFHGAGELSGIGDGYVVADLSDGGNGSEFVLREAAAWFSGLPGGTRLRAGKYYPQLGRWNHVYATDLPSLNIDGTRRAYLGGNLSLTGLEMHGGRSRDGFGWSLGIGGDIESHDPDIPENGVGRISGGGERTGIKNWAAVGRMQTGGNDFTGGISAYYTPGETHETSDGVRDLNTLLVGADISGLKMLGGHAWRQWSLELWQKSGDTYLEPVNPLGNVVDYYDPNSWGWSGQAAYGFNRTWSMGALASSWQHFPDPNQERGHYLSSFLDHSFGPSHRLRFSFSHINPGPGIQKFYAVGVQWTMGFGQPRTTSYLRRK